MEHKRECRRENKRGGHINEHLKTEFVGHGNRAAGIGVVCDDYSEDSGLYDYDPGAVKVVLPADRLTPQQRKELSGPVVVTKIEGVR